MQGKHVKDQLLRAVAVIGLIAILLLGAWGIIQLAVGLPDFFSNFGVSKNTALMSENLRVAAPVSLNSDQSFPLTWVHANRTGAYSYSVSYACASGLMFASPVPTGALKLIPCDTNLNFVSATSSLTLTPVTSTTNTLSTTITVRSTRLSDNKVTATATTPTIIVSPKSSAAAVAPATKHTSYTPTHTQVVTHAPRRVSTLYGTGNLTPQIVAATPLGGGRYQVQFSIQNSGTNMVPAGWMFSANLPTNPSYTFSSVPQQRLLPGDSIVYTLAFEVTQISTQTYNYGRYSNNSNCGYQQNYTYNGYANYPTDPSYNPTCAPSTYLPNYYANTPNYYNNSVGGNLFTLTVDPQNIVLESSKTDNTASVTVY